MTLPGRSLRTSIAAWLAIVAGPSAVQAGLMLEIVDSNNNMIFSASQTQGASNQPDTVHGGYNGGPIGGSGRTTTPTNSTRYNYTVSATSNSPGGLDDNGDPANGFARIVNSLSITSSAAGTIKIELIDDNFTIPGTGAGNYLQSTIRTSVGPQNNVSFGTQSYADAANGDAFLAGTIGPAATTGSVTTTGFQGPFNSTVNGNTADASFANTGAFSLLNVITVTFGAGGGSVILSTEADVFAPEPASIGMVLSGLPVAYFLMKRRRAATAARA